MGEADLVLAGGTEALSHTPLVLPDDMAAWLGRFQAAGAVERAKLLAELRPSHFAPIVSLLRGLTDPNCGLNMGQTAEILAHRFGIAREDADAYALESHRRLARAQEEGRLKEIEPMFDTKGELFELDTGVRPDSTLADLRALPPAFEKPYGDITAGNSSQVTDGASWILLASGTACERHGLDPIAEVIDSEWTALDPQVMGLGPVFCATPLMERHDLALDDIDLWEINEAFAAQVLACLSAWESERFCREQLGHDSAVGAIDRQRLNVDGGAIAVGHPVGTSGNRILLHLALSLRQRQVRRGIATECVGGGQGGAMLLEAV